MTLAYILLACLVGSAVSLVLAALIAWRAQPKVIPLFVSYAVGALLGVVFLDLLPHIFESTRKFHEAAGWILAGIMAFFVLEKMVLWRHNHDHAGQAEAAMAGHQQYAQNYAHGHTHDDVHQGRESSAWMVIIGDGFHNFTDGMVIAAAFTADIKLGIVTALAIIAHELPQELGDFVVLIHSGFSKSRALFWNLMSSLATLVGAMIAYFAMSLTEGYSNIFLCIAAASMIYVAIADLIPGLHKRATLKDTVQQISLVAFGIGSIWGVHWLIGHG